MTALTGSANSRQSAAMSTAPTPSSGVGACSNPVGLRRTTTDTRTGSVASTDFQKRCGTRIESKCPSCSALYKGDAFQVIRSGLFDHVTKLPKLVTMVTLTAPGSDRFGQTHSRHLDKSGNLKRCACRAYHNEGDYLIGSPLDPSTYDYEAAAAFNANASRLFAVTMQKLGRILGRKLRVVRVVEFQSRGLVHIHALVLGPVTQRSLELVVRGGVNLRTGRMIKAAKSNNWTWGEQCKADVITGNTPGKAIAYLVKVVKYALKDTGSGSCTNHSHGDRMDEAAERGFDCAKSIYDCRLGHRLMTVEREHIDTTTGEVTRTRFPIHFQGHATRLTCRRHRRAVQGWGFRGHVLAKSRNWGCTFREVRERRQQWAHAQKPNLPEHLIVTWEILPRDARTLTAPGNSPP